MKFVVQNPGIDEYECHERVGQARYPSLEAFMETHLRLAGEFDDLDGAVFQEMLNKAITNMRTHISTDKQLITQLNVRIFKIRAA